jgi:hypothetical protein
MSALAAYWVQGLLHDKSSISAPVFTPSLRLFWRCRFKIKAALVSNSRSQPGKKKDGARNIVCCERGDMPSCSRPVVNHQGRGSGIKAKRTSAKAGGIVSLAVTEARRHWQAVTSIDGTAMVGAHPARLPRQWQHGRHGASKGGRLPRDLGIDWEQGG